MPPENNLTSYMVSRHSETARYFSWTEHVMVPDVLFISTRSWEKLSSRQQQWLQQAVANSSKKMVVLWDEAGTEKHCSGQKRGGDFY